RTRAGPLRTCRTSMWVRSRSARCFRSGCTGTLHGNPACSVRGDRAACAGRVVRAAFAGRPDPSGGDPGRRPGSRAGDISGLTPAGILIPARGRGSDIFRSPSHRDSMRSFLTAPVFATVEASLRARLWHRVCWAAVVVAILSLAVLAAGGAVVQAALARALVGLAIAGIAGLLAMGHLSSSSLARALETARAELAVLRETGRRLDEERASRDREQARLQLDLGERMKELRLLHFAARLLQSDRPFNNGVLSTLVTQ